MYTFRHLLAFFMFYAVGGWCIEVIYKTTCTGKFVNRGFLNGPLCPIYGVGVTIVILCLTPLSDNLLLLYAGSVLLTSALEFITGFVMEKIFHQKWWDYSKEHFNLMGYICLRFSLLWGIACVFVMKIIQPLVLLVFSKTPELLKTIVFICFYSLMLADLIITVAALARVQMRLRLANDLDRFLNNVAEAFGTRLSNSTIKGMKELQEKKEQLGELKDKAEAHIEDIRERAELHIEEFKERTESQRADRKAEYDALLREHKARERAQRERLSELEERCNKAINEARNHYGDSYLEKTEQKTFVQKRLEKAYPSLDFSRISSRNLSKKLNDIKNHFTDSSTTHEPD